MMTAWIAGPVANPFDEDRRHSAVSPIREPSQYHATMLPITNGVVNSFRRVFGEDFKIDDDRDRIVGPG